MRVDAYRRSRLIMVPDLHERLCKQTEALRKLLSLERTFWVLHTRRKSFRDDFFLGLPLLTCRSFGRENHPYWIVSQVPSLSCASKFEMVQFREFPRVLRWIKDWMVLKVRNVTGYDQSRLKIWRSKITHRLGKVKFFLAPHSRSSPRRVNMYIFSSLILFDARDGLRREGGTARSYFMCKISGYNYLRAVKEI